MSLIFLTLSAVKGSVKVTRRWKLICGGDLPCRLKGIGKALAKRVLGESVLIIWIRDDEERLKGG